MTATTGIAFAQNEQKSTKSKTVTINVKEITCSTDMKMTVANVHKLKGISSLKTSKAGTQSSFEVKYNTALVTEKEIRSAIANTGTCSSPGSASKNL